MTKTNACRFCRLFAASVVGFAAPIGALMTAQFWFGTRQFGGSEYVSRVVILSALRATGPAVSGSALLLALVLWAHPLSSAQLQAELRRMLLRGLAVAVPGYVVAVPVTLASSFAALCAFGQSWETFRSGFAGVGWHDLGVGVLGTSVDAALGVFLAWRYLARLQASGMSLPAKLVAVVTVTVGLRATLGLLLSSMLSG